MSVIDDVRRVLPAEFQTAREIWQAMNCWSPTSAQRQLEALVASGEAERRTDPHPGCINGIHRYRRKGEAA